MHEDSVIAIRYALPLPPLNTAPWSPPLRRTRRHEDQDRYFASVEYRLRYEGPIPMTELESMLMTRLKED